MATFRNCNSVNDENYPKNCKNQLKNYDKRLSPKTSVEERRNSGKKKDIVIFLQELSESVK